MPQITFHKLLFLCTGNYYRSRFAEILFNAQAREAGLPWLADSRGIAADDLGIHNVGSISSYTLAGLEAIGISIEPPIRYPKQLQTQDLTAADLIIALAEEEHRALLTERFPAWSDCVEYWHVNDIGLTPAEEALAEIERQITALIRRLAEQPL